MSCAKLSKPNLMRAAWAKFRECRGLVAFAECLRRAWRAVKNDLAMREAMASMPAPKTVHAGSPAFGFRRGADRRQYGLRFLGT